MVTWLIDISNHQGTFDVARAVSEGYSGVWMKATEGTSFRDQKFDTFARQVLTTDAVPGAYHYLRAGSGRAQCDAFYGRIRDHGGPGGWLAACDNEADASWTTTKDFFTRWRELAVDHPLFMYSGNWWWGPRGWNGASLTPYLWDSRYVSGSGSGSALYAKVPASWWTSRYGGWRDVTVLQFASSATVAGRSPVDVNAFRGSVDELRALARSGHDEQLVTRRRSDVFLAYVPGKPTIVPTDGGTWHDEIPYEQTQQMVADGIPMVRVTDQQMELYLGLPFPGQVGAAVVEAVNAVRDLVLALSTGAVDVVALAAALAPLLPVAPTAAAVADAVVDETAGRLAE